MEKRNNILIVKYGALGDVIRTSYFAKALRARYYSSEKISRIYWLTSPSSTPLLRFNPYIDVIETSVNSLSNIYFDEIYSLDDELDILSNISHLRSGRVIGAKLDVSGNRIYCDQSATWFDMGLLSVYGKNHADELKKINNKTHSEIFRDIFKVDEVDFTFYNSIEIVRNAGRYIEAISEERIPVGLNAFAGKRWLGKALSDQEFPRLVEALSAITYNSKKLHIFLIGAGSDLQKNRRYVELIGSPSNITALDTDDNLLDLAAAIRSLKLLVTADSLCLHLAVSQQIPTVAFFSPTSSAEIEGFPSIRKVCSLSPDSCSYNPNADNSTITADRILLEINALLDKRPND